MATLPTAYEWSSNETVTAAHLNDQIRDGLGWFLNTPRCLVYRSQAKSFSSLTFAVMDWDTADFDSDGMFSGTSSVPSSRITFRTAGIYVVQVHILWQGVNESIPAENTGDRCCIVALNKNGATSSSNGSDSARIAQHQNTVGSTASSTVPQTNHVRFMRKFAVGDYIEVTLMASSTNSTISTTSGIQTCFGARWIGSG